MRERGLYPAQIEKLTGIRRQRIHEYLNGTVQPSAYAVKLIATGLDISADWLLGIEKESAFYEKIPVNVVVGHNRPAVFS